MYCSTHICTWHDLSIIQIWIFEMYREFNNARKYLLPVWKSHIQSERIPPIHPYRRPSFMSKHAQRTQIHVYTQYTQRNSLSLSNTSSRNKLQRPEKLILTCYHERTTRISLSLSLSLGHGGPAHTFLAFHSFRRSCSFLIFVIIIFLAISM